MVSSKQSFRNQANKTPEDQTSASILWKKRSTIINIVCSVLFMAYAYCAMAVRRGDMLFRGQELSLFLFDGTYFGDMMREPAGLLEYIGNFLTQFFYYPYIGSAIFVLMLWGLQFMSYKAFRMSPSLYLLSWVPSACMLLYVTQMDYSLFVMKSDNVFYLHLLGLMAALIPLLISPVKIRNKCRLVFFYLIIGYPLFGFYALLGIVLMIIAEWSAFLFKKRRGWVYLVFGPVFTAIVPLMYYGLYDGIALRFVYIYGLPFMNFLGAAFMWMPLIFCYVLLAVYALIFSLPVTSQNLTARRWVNALIVPACILFVYLFGFRDLNFDTQMAMERAVARDDWKAVMKIAAKPNPTPNRIIILYRNMAMWKNHTLCDKMFTYSNVSEKLYTQNRQASQTEVGACVIPFYYGLLNYCYRWNMENTVANGPAVQNYKYMLRYAVLRAENELAERYAGKLDKTLFYRKWAAEQLNYVAHPETIQDNKVYADLLPLLKFNTQLGMEEKIMERTILKHFRSLQSGSNESLDLVMASILTAKDVERFWPIFFVYVQKNLPIPLHVQEAALLIAYFEKRDLSPLGDKIDAGLKKRFEEYMRMAGRYKDLSEEQMGEKLKPMFAKTYWYYFNFVSELKAN